MLKIVLGIIRAPFFKIVNVSGNLKPIKEFIKFNTTSIIATLVDFLVFVFLIKIIGVYYIYSTIIGAICGGITSFYLNRNWVFEIQKKDLKIQVIKFVLTWIGSITFNTLGLYVLIDIFKVGKVLSKIIVGISVGVLYNYTINKYYVFKI